MDNSLHHPLYEAYTTQWSHLLSTMTPDERVFSLKGQQEYVEGTSFPDPAIREALLRWLRAQERNILGPGEKREEANS